MRRSATAIVAMIVSVALTACSREGGPVGETTRAGPESRPAAPSSAVDPCALLTAEEARAAVGTAVAPPERGDDEAGPSCLYRVAPPRFGGVTLTLLTEEVQFEFLRERPGSRPVPGVGDAAVVTPDGRIGVVKGSRAFTVTVLRPKAGEKAALATLASLARSVLSRAAALPSPGPNRRTT